MEELKKKKREELDSNRYSAFRDEFKDIFEDIVDRKNQMDSESKKL